MPCLLQFQLVCAGVSKILRTTLSLATECLSSGDRDLLRVLLADNASRCLYILVNDNSCFSADQSYIFLYSENLSLSSSVR